MVGSLGTWYCWVGLVSLFTEGAGVSRVGVWSVQQQAGPDVSQQRFIKSVRLCCTFCGKRTFLGKSSLVLDFPAVCVEMPTWPSLSTTTIRPYMKPSFCLYVLWQCLQHCPLHSHTHGLQPCPPSRVGMKVLTLFFVSIWVIYFSCNLSSDFSVELTHA